MVNAVTTRIHWTNPERHRVVRKAIDIMIDKGYTVLDAIRYAQAMEIHRDRQRRLTTLQSCRDIADMVKAGFNAATSVPTPEPSRIEAPAAPQTTLEQSLNDLVNTLAKKFSEVLKEEVRKAVVQLENEFNVSKHDPTYESTRTAKPRVIIIGLLGDQVHNIDHEFGSVFDLKFVDTDRAMGLTPPDADAYLLMKNFINHPLYHKYRDFPNHVLIDGGMTSLRTWLHKTANERVSEINRLACAH